MKSWESLSKSQRAAYQRTVERGCDRRLSLQLLRINGSVVRTFHSDFLGGSVDGRRAEIPAESFTFRIADPEGTLDWEAGEHRRFDVRVLDDRWIPALDDWVRVVGFTGPLWDFRREGPEVELTAHSMERRAMGTVRGVFQRGRKTRATKVIRELLNAAGFEGRDLRIPARKNTLPRRVTVTVKRKQKGKVVSKSRKLRATWEDTYYAQARKVASAINRQLLADLHGVLVLRPHPSKPVMTLDERHMTAPPRYERAGREDMANTFTVLGADPKGPKPQIRETVSFHPKHKLSKQSLSRHGKPYELKDVEQNDQIKRKRDARAVAIRRRDDAQRQTVGISVEIVPVLPWITLGERVRIVDPDGFGTHIVRVNEYTKPFNSAADPMTLGIVVSDSSRRRRPRRGKFVPAKGLG